MTKGVGQLDKTNQMGKNLVYDMALDGMSHTQSEWKELNLRYIQTEAIAIWLYNGMRAHPAQTYISKNGLQHELEWNRSLQVYRNHPKGGL